MMKIADMVGDNDIKASAGKDNVLDFIQGKNPLQRTINKKHSPLIAMVEKIVSWVAEHVHVKKAHSLTPGGAGIRG